jgi:hypothetical protein
MKTTMTPSPTEKAKELVEKFNTPETNVNQWGVSQLQRDFAIILCDEVIEVTKFDPDEKGFEELDYWISVRSEIEKL